ncbi:ABC transporter permease [Paenibacillus cremeus]|uniref:Sugar ABC transporter permease n=1 Tax=Paenibacillus cremeus TaxID=2163881 RepID=A0A559KGQ9_9BACL|nr:ABC transporter permease subunit [Paenibacillus cremeus]TVY11301.1 sugar ABC transporter permease [Paenibacillus cremeus]
MQLGERTLTTRKSTFTTLRSAWKVQKSLYFKYRYAYVLVMPGVLYFLLFKLAPMWGLLLAFKDYSPFAGFWHSEWAGLKYFKEFFASDYFYLMFRNTTVISLMNLVFYFPAPILLALLINEVRLEKFKRLNQTIIYMPHFLSWVVIAGMTFFMLSSDVGLVNKIVVNMGGKPIAFLSNPDLFWWVLLLQNTWKEIGWGTILFLAAMSQIDPTHYEAATIDGATRMQKIWRVTVPSIMPTIIVLFILRLGHMMDVGFEQVLLMTNPFVRDVAEVFDTYSYNQGINQGNFSIAVTVGIFKSIVGLIMVLIADRAVKKMGHSGIY